MTWLGRSVVGWTTLKMSWILSVEWRGLSLACCRQRSTMRFHFSCGRRHFSKQCLCGWKNYWKNTHVRVDKALNMMMVSVWIFLVCTHLIIFAYFLPSPFSYKNQNKKEKYGSVALDLQYENTSRLGGGHKKTKVAKNLQCRPASNQTLE